MASSFLLLIGFTLIVEGLHQHIPKSRIYFAMAFSVFVETLNLHLKKVSKAPVQPARLTALPSKFSPDRNVPFSDAPAP